MRSAGLGPDDADQQAALAFAAGVFDPLPLRVTGTLEAARLESLVEQARGRFGIPADRVLPSAPGLVSGFEVLRRR